MRQCGRFCGVFRIRKRFIVRKDKDLKRAEVICQSMDAEQRERAGIEKMFAVAGIHADEKLIKSILRLNKKFGIYHTQDMLNDSEALLEKCMDKREKALVSDFFALWKSWCYGSD